MFGRATIRLGIGPHSSFNLYYYYIHENEARDDGLAVASAGQYANHLHLAPESRHITTPAPQNSYTYTHRHRGLSPQTCRGCQTPDTLELRPPHMAYFSQSRCNSIGKKLMPLNPKRSVPEQDRHLFNGLLKRKNTVGEGGGTG